MFTMFKTLPVKSQMHIISVAHMPVSWMFLLENIKGKKLCIGKFCQHLSEEKFITRKI